jgi:hypothetical protein
VGYRTRSQGQGGQGKAQVTGHFDSENPKFTNCANNAKYYNKYRNFYNEFKHNAMRSYSQLRHIEDNTKISTTLLVAIGKMKDMKDLKDSNNQENLDKISLNFASIIGDIVRKS